MIWCGLQIKAILNIQTKINFHFIFYYCDVFHNYCHFLYAFFYIRSQKYLQLLKKCLHCQCKWCKFDSQFVNLWDKNNHHFYCNFLKFV